MISFFDYWWFYLYVVSISFLCIVSYYSVIVEPEIFLSSLGFWSDFTSAITSKFSAVMSKLRSIMYYLGV